MEPVVKLSAVSVVRSGTTLLDGIDWEVMPDQRWVVLGPNGAGKSTLLQVVGAQMHPTSGTAQVLGETLGQVDVFDLRTRIGHTAVTIADRLPRDEAVENVVLSAAYAVTGRWREQYDDEDHRRCQQILGEMGVQHLARRTFGTLSEGERKRVLIARALMTDPELLLLDEPGAGLDLGAREDLLLSLTVLATSPQAPATIMVSHHVEEIPVGFTHVLMLRDGKVVAAGPIDDVLSTDNLGATFGMRLHIFVDDGRYMARRSTYGTRRAL